MAFFRGDVYSYALDKMTSLNVYLPQDDISRCGIHKPMSTLILLHGLQGNNSFWYRYSSVERYAQEHNIALIMPEAEMSQYVDMRCGLNYGEYIGKELKSLVGSMFRVPTERCRYGIAGFSMGGYGALRLALCYPEEFGRCMSISGALMMGGPEHLKQLREWDDSGKKSYYDPDEELTRTFKRSAISAFGPELLSLKEFDVMQTAQAAAHSGKELPNILMTCGREDFTLDSNIAFDKCLTDMGIKHELSIWEGTHCWKFVDESMQKYISFFAED